MIKINRQYEKWLVNTDMDIFITLNFNRPATLEGAKDKFGILLAYIDRYYLGRDWSKRSKYSRTRAIASVENVTSNIHLHSAMLLPKRKPPNFEFIQKSWRKLTTSGTGYIENITDKDRALSYILKNVESSDLIIIAEDFMHSQ